MPRVPAFAAPRLYEVVSCSPGALACALQGTPVVVPGTSAEVVLSCEYPVAILRVTVAAVAFTAHRPVENVPGECTRRSTVNVTVQPEGVSSFEADAGSFISTWKGAVQPLADGWIRIRLSVPGLPKHTTQRCSSIDVRSIAVSLHAGDSAFGAHLAAPNRGQAALDAQSGGDIVMVQLQEPGAQPLCVSRFALELRSAVLREALKHAAAQEFSLGDYPDASVRAFLQMLHSAEYTGPVLEMDELVALYALGEAYRIQEVMHEVVQEVTARPMRSEDLHRTLAAAQKYSGGSAELWKCLHVKVRTCARSVMKKRPESLGAGRASPAASWTLPGTPRHAKRSPLPPPAPAAAAAPTRR